MGHPDFGGVIRHSRQRESILRSGTPQAIPYGTRIYRCECCNDTGVVQVWKLNRWAMAPGETPLDSTTSLPVFCQHLPSCGNSTMQVFAGNRDNDESGSRTAEVNLLRGNSSGDSQLRERIASGQLKVLSPDQSRFIHHAVLDYREWLSVHQQGRSYVDAVKAACRDAMPDRSTCQRVGGLTPIGEMLCRIDLPLEPPITGDPNPTVALSDPRDFTPTPGTTPADNPPLPVSLDAPTSPPAVTVDELHPDNLAF